MIFTSGTWVRLTLYYCRTNNASNPDLLFFPPGDFFPPASHLGSQVIWGVIGSLHKAYPGLWNAAHQCLASCIGPYAGFPSAKGGC
jgi:hypothetical protein